MASVDTLNNPNDPNNPNAAANLSSQAPQGQTNQPATSGGAGAVTATGAGNVTGQVVGTANPAQPFQNISSYLAANEPQSQQLASQVAGTVSAPITQAQQGITNAANTFTQSVNAGYTPANNDLITAVSQNPAYVVGENPENVTNFLGQLHNKYTGPTDFTQSPDYANLEAQIANAQGQAQATQTPQGIQTLLNAVEGPTTAGINKLDSLLLTNNPENISNIQAAGAPAAALPGTLTDTASAQNLLAQQGQNTASTTAAAAAKALQDALTAEQGNLSTQQNTIEGIVNQYNQSVGIINPVTQAIAQDIQNYLAANPNLKLSNATDVLAPLTNLQTIGMPDIGTYASPFDYKTVAALAQLGLDPSALAGLPINAAQSNLAQTFKVPEALQNAVGQAPGVEAALQQELTGLGNQIQTAYQPYQDLMAKENTRADLRTQLDQLQTPLQQATIALNQAKAAVGTGSGRPAIDAANQKALADAQAKYDALVAQKQSIMDKATAAGVADNLYGSYWDYIGQMAQGLQWLAPASTGYNDLISAINEQLGKLGNVGVPTLNYAATTLTDPVTGAPIGKIAKDIGNVGAIATGAGATGAGAAAGLSAAEAAAAGNAAEGFGEGLATSGAPGAYEAAQTGQLLSSGLQAAGPAALAAYGTSNVVQNSIAHPIEAGLSTLANMGLSLATLSLPPQIFNSIGSAIKNVVNSIGDFFGGLF